MPSDHCIIDSETGKFTCENCGAMEGYELPAPIDSFVKAINDFLEKHQGCTMADGPIQTAVFTGHSDDIVYVEGVKGGDEFGCYQSDDDKLVHATFVLGGKLKVYAIYDGCWSFAVGLVDEDDIPEWPIRHKGFGGHSSIVEIDVPAGVRLVREGE